MRQMRLAGQPALGLAGIALVIPVVVVLGLGWGGPERSLLVLGPMSTFALPVIAMIGFWWERWPGTMLRPPLTGLVDTVLVAMAGIALTIAGQAVVAHVDLRGVFDAGAGPGHAPTFPSTMPLAGAFFVAMLELTLVSERWPLNRLNRYAGGLAALAAAWTVAVLLYEWLVAGPASVPGAEFGAVLVCIGVLQVAFYVVLRGWPFSVIGSRTRRLCGANLAVVGGGFVVYLMLARVAGLDPAIISAVAGSAVAAGLVVGMLFDGWPASLLPPARARAAQLISVAVTSALLYAGLRVYAHGVGWTRAEPTEWIAYAGLNAIGAGVILHVAIGHRWPFAPPATSDQPALGTDRASLLPAATGALTLQGMEITDIQTKGAMNDAIARIVAIGGLVAIALIHMLQLPDAFEEAGYLGGLFIAAVAASLTLAAVMTRTSDDRAWLAAGGLAGLILLGYVLSRSVGLPGFTDDVGEWSEVPGLASMVAESLLGIVAVAVLVPRRMPLRRASTAPSSAGAAKMRPAAG